MKTWQRLAVVVVGVVALGTAAARAERGLDMPGFTAEWHPVIGVGGAYTAQVHGGKTTTWEMVVVGREGDGYWIEMYLPEMRTIMKTLASPRGVTRSIVKTEDQPAMEMPASFMAAAPKMDVKQTGQDLGEEQVTTPAGTFTCRHYRITEQSGPADVWVTDRVSPYGLVKMISPEASMTLQRIIINAHTRITEAPQSFQMPNLPNMPGGGGGDLSTLMQGVQSGAAHAGGHPAGVSQQDISNLLQSLQQQGTEQQ